MSRLLFLILIFIFFGAFFIISNNNLHLNRSGEFDKFGKMYYSWLSGLFENVKSITGYAIRFDWIPNLNTTDTEIVKKTDKETPVSNLDEF